MSLPYLPLYVDDYEAATAHLSLLEDGAYSRLLRLCWRSPGCKLPNDAAWIERKLRASSEADKAAVSSVLAEFFTTGRGKIWSKRLLEVHMQKTVAHTARVEAGKIGGAAKALKTKKTGPSNAGGNAKAMLKQPEPEPSIYTKANALDGKPVDFAKAIFENGVKFLCGHGADEAKARSVIGKWRKSHPDREIFDALAACNKAEVIDPIPWITAKLTPPPSFTFDLSKFGETAQ